jgi:hypothetical protein
VRYPTRAPVTSRPSSSACCSSSISPDGKPTIPPDGRAETCRTGRDEPRAQHKVGGRLSSFRTIEQIPTSGGVVRFDDFVPAVLRSSRSDRLPPVKHTKRTLRMIKIDFAPRHKPPAAILVLVASFIAIAGSIGADAILVAIGTRVFPATAGYVHFRFSDYGKLTIIGVIIACSAWPIVTRISSNPRWVFLRMAILVTLVLLLPDFYLLAKGQRAKAVTVLMTMHLAIGIVTYSALVHLAPVRREHRRYPEQFDTA